MEKSIREKILELPRPITRKLSDIADDLNATRQYVYQIVQEEGIPYIPWGIKKRKFCRNKKCTNLTPSVYRVYCDKCKGNQYYIRRKGEYRPCSYCGKPVYRRKSLLDRLKTGNVFCNSIHMGLFHKRGAIHEHNVLTN